nr:MAG TPA: hypothetical protein [Caudoviricetes sp.]
MSIHALMLVMMNEVLLIYHQHLILSFLLALTLMILHLIFLLIFLYFE